MRWSYGKIGLVLAGEEHSATDLVRFGRAAEKAGFGFLFLSDHFHPWNLRQAHSSYVWSVLGALAQSTETIGLVSAVTCPILRIHPTALAQAASTVYHLSGGRFVLGLGTGEALNEKVMGIGFPCFGERLARLKEALEQVRELLTGTEVSRRGRFFTTERATLFDPAPSLPVLFGCSGEKTLKAALELADGIITLGLRPELSNSVPSDKVRLVQLSFCWAKTREEGAQTAHRYFPEVALDGLEFIRLSTPTEYTEATTKVSVGDVEASIICGPDPEPYLAQIVECLQLGYDGVALHQIGPEQDGFLNFWSERLATGLPS